MRIHIDGVTHVYDKACALDQVTLTLQPGFNVLLGSNGAGKSTLFAVLTGLLPVTQGNVQFDGHTLAAQRRKIMSKIGVVFQQSTLDIDLTVAQNLSYFAALHGLSAAASIHRLKPVLSDLGLEQRLNWKVRKLNGGHRRRLEIARCLIHDPSVLLLDEPTVGLDIASRKLIVDVVHDLAHNHQVTVLWTTHLLEEVRNTDTVILLANGKVKGQGQCEALLQDFACDSINEVFNQLVDVG